MTPSVFVIEDDFAVRDSLIQLLRAEGLRARGFANGEEFFANLPTDRIACIVTDLRMPGMDGVEVVNRIADLHGDAWPVVIITGHGDVSSAVSLMKAGVTDFIEKPFEPHRLIETLKGCLNRIRQVDERLQTQASIDRRLAQLTARERQVFDQLAQGLSNKEIAANLEISPRTVEIFRAKVMTKMEAANLSALVRTSLGLE
ncbi:MAG: fixJ [Brevundimonas sp.]|nr:fixJ [Brevundimonas sp.]